MKTSSSATRIVATFGLVSFALLLAGPAAWAGPFFRRTVIVESPPVFVTPVETVYAAPVSTVVSAPTTTIYQGPVVDPLLVPSAYVPTVSTRVVSTPVTTTYIPTVTTVPTVVVPRTRVRVVSPRRVYRYDY